MRYLIMYSDLPHSGSLDVLMTTRRWSSPVMGPLTPKFDRATWPFLKIDM